MTANASSCGLICNAVDSNVTLNLTGGGIIINYGAYNDINNVALVSGSSGGYLNISCSLSSMVTINLQSIGAAVSGNTGAATTGYLGSISDTYCVISAL